MKKFIIATGFLMTTFSANAEFVNGEKLLNLMNSTNQVEKAVSTGYIVGVIDTLSGSFICPKASVKASEMVQIVFTTVPAIDKKHLSSTSADVVISAILSKVYPCEKLQETI